MLFSVLGGFYLPFVYDVVLSATSLNYRGTACGVIDIVVNSSAVSGLVIVLLFGPKEVAILGMTTVLFLVATIAQKFGEAHVQS
jgi:hypothetical protein